MHYEYVIPEHMVEKFNVGNAENAKRLLNRAVKYFHKIARPMYVGPLALELGISLKQLQVLIDVLEDNNLIRRASEEEISSMGIWKDKNVPIVYALSENARPELAYD